MIFFFFNIVLSISNSNSSLPNHFTWKESDINFITNSQVSQCYEIRGAFTFNSCTFKSFYCNEKGGALYIQYDHNFNYDVDININKCFFIKCSSKEGGSIYATTTVRGLLNFEDCNFLKNSAKEAGGSIWMKTSKGTFYNCVFNGNEVSNLNQPNECYGGAVYCDDTKMTIFSSCSLINNFIYGYQSDLLGGAIYMNNSIISFSYTTFINNSIRFKSNDGKYLTEGGAIYSTNSQDMINNCNFTNNTIWVNSMFPRIEGAALYTGDNKEFNNCNFYNNSVFLLGRYSEIYSSYLSGGILYFRKCIGLKNCVFNYNYIKNQKSSVYGGFVYSNSFRFFSNCNFTNNYMECIMENEFILGGLIDVEKDMNLDNCNFFNNTLEMDERSSSGNVLMVRIINMFKCNFTKNIFISTISAKSSGGVISTSIGEIKECTFIDNNATQGYNIYSSSSEGNSFSIIDCTFECNFKFPSSEKKSLIYEFVAYGVYYSYQFINNKVTFSKDSNIMIFDGYVSMELKFYCEFRNNCLYPYQNSFYKTPSFSIYDSSNEKIPFSKAFNNCIIPTKSFTPSQIFTPSKPFTKSRTFTKSKKFTPSKKFTASKSFTSSMPFTCSKTFTSSKIFTDSKTFTNSKTFTDSTLFTKSEQFSSSKHFTESKNFSDSTLFSKSKPFTISIIFTETEPFTSSRIFSQSKYFTNSKSFSASQPFTKSITFSSSNKFTKINVFSKSNLFQANFSHDEKNSKLYIFSIIGIALGGLSVCLICVMMIYLLKKKQNEMPNPLTTQNEPNNKAFEPQTNQEDNVDRDIDFWL